MTDPTDPARREGDAAPGPLLRALLAHPVLAADTYPDPDPAIPADPAALFTAWLRDALAAGVPDAQVMTLSTVDAGGRPDARVLVLRDVDRDAAAWHFWTEPDSPKARQFAARPDAALTVYWPAPGRQVRLHGPVRPAPAASPPPRPSAATPCTPPPPSSGRPPRPAPTGACATPAPPAAGRPRAGPPPTPRADRRHPSRRRSQS
ncbi:hypothetical protein KCH_65290 [Kitasatospora cheerisanensis KCTC 2395]|uniref:Pyridoxamine 5'-phosphate oxidase N-terminal domain-containing protein n=1 Tax=Kitasatospora cheerisanensis KCTC 2395 TaxID=1348663 RepID=A0A066YPA5_9ACTN|nr:pyridoxamine 5'-phosphate oxidase family protein [Kitasatospora cheerisanensis]KDN81809.1 hypothetical protein KCH_65290 [Kitasatospora cheerisanensis KCTC 2395]